VGGRGGGVGRWSARWQPRGPGAVDSEPGRSPVAADVRAPAVVEGPDFEVELGPPREAAAGEVDVERVGPHGHVRVPRVVHVRLPVRQPLDDVPASPRRESPLRGRVEGGVSKPAGAGGARTGGEPGAPGGRAAAPRFTRAPYRRRSSRRTPSHRESPRGCALRPSRPDPSPQPNKAPSSPRPCLPDPNRPQNPATTRYNRPPDASLWGLSASRAHFRVIRFELREGRFRSAALRFYFGGGAELIITSSFPWRPALSLIAPLPLGGGRDAVICTASFWRFVVG